MTAALWLALWLQTPPPPPPPVAVLEAGLGFRARTRVPNVERRDPEPRGPQFVARADAWMTFQAVIENNGPPVEGTLVLRDAWAGGRGLVFQKRLTLPSRSRKRVAFPVLHSLANPFRLSLEDASGRAIPVENAPSVEVQAPYTLAIASSLVVVATESNGNFSHFLRPNRDGAFSQERYVVPVTPSDLPTQAIEYHGVDALVLDDVALDALSVEQQEAILQFTARGGVLVVALLRNGHRVAGTLLEAALPATPAATRNVAEIAALARVTGSECKLDAPLGLTTFALRPGASAWDAATPVAAHRPFERGTVVALGFPLSSRFLETWPASSRFMDGLAAGRPAPLVPMAGEYQASGLRHDLAVALKSSMIRRLPPFKQVLGLMGAYAAVVVLLPIALTFKSRRLEWSWVFVFAIALAGSGVVYALGARYIRGESVAHRIGLIEGGSEGGPHLRHNFWSVFTARGERLELSFEEPSAVPFHFGRELSLRGTSGEVEPLTVGYDGVRLRGLRTYTQDSTLFETTDLQRLPSGLRAFANENGRVVVKGDPAFPLHGGWVVSDNRVMEVKGLGAGEADVAYPGEPLRKVLDGLSSEPDRLLLKAQEALLNLASAESRARKVPIFLYRYEGDPSLKGSAIREQGYDFGWTEVQNWPRDASRVQWSMRQTSVVEEVSGGSGDIEFVLSLTGLPDGWRVVDLRPSRTSDWGVRIDLFSLASNAWVAAASRSIPAASYVHYGPLGTAAVRIRFRFNGELREREDPKYVMNSFRVESTIERSPR